MMRCQTCRSRWDKDAPFELLLHTDQQDTSAPGWLRFLDLLEEAMTRGETVFRPFLDIPLEDHAGVVTLPPEIGTYHALEELILYASPLLYVPPELGRLPNLRKFHIYTSPELHWLPYELTRCPALDNTSMSTRNVYGNHKNRAPFPDLTTPTSQAFLTRIRPETCSVCDATLDPAHTLHRWHSLWVGTDITPLLLHACSQACIDAVPDGPDVPRPHTGGAHLTQPPTIRRRPRRPE